VASVVRETLADLLAFEVKDPRLAGITITDVEVTGDLREARVFYTMPAGHSEPAAVSAGLRSASGFLRRALGQRVRLRTLPELQFRHDTSYEYGERIERKLAELGLGETQPDPDDADEEG